MPENNQLKKHLNLSKSSSSSASLSSSAESGWFACEKSEMAMRFASIYNFRQNILNLVSVLIYEAQYKRPLNRKFGEVRQQHNKWMQSKHFLVCARRIHDALPPKFHPDPWNVFDDDDMSRRHNEMCTSIHAQCPSTESTVAARQSSTPSEPLSKSSGKSAQTWLHQTETLETPQNETKSS